jgi:hypothetical protein
MSTIPLPATTADVTDAIYDLDLPAATLREIALSTAVALIEWTMIDDADRADEDAEDAEA